MRLHVLPSQDTTHGRGQWRARQREKPFVFRHFRWWM